MTIHNNMFDNPKANNHQVYKAAGLTAGEIRDMPRYLAGVDEFYGTSAFHKLYDYFVFEASHISKMPYGVAKADEGEPDTWILERLSRQ